MRMNLSAYPTPNKVHSVDLPRLSGGLNLWELDYRLDPNESPNMENLWWQDGVIQCRDGQEYLGDGAELGTGLCCYKQLFHGYAFFHIGISILYGDPAAESFRLSGLYTGVPTVRGTFFRYQDALYYKTKGAFIRIDYHEGEAPLFTASDATQSAYVPVIVINAAPATGSGDTYQPENRLSARKTIWYNAESGATAYHLPVAADSVGPVYVGDVLQQEGNDYTYSAGVVTFVTAPPVTTPPTNNTVRITYTLPNPDAYSSVMDCEYAFVAGGDQRLCILLGGCDAQPNAVFWNSNDALGMNPTYFPMTYYNLVGGTADPVTGFGSQYSMIMVFKAKSIGKLNFTTQTVDGRESLSFTYEPVNDRWGCDLPWTIETVDNNLVFCNTQQGVHMIRAASAAYENNVVQLSKKVNGNETRGLLKDVRSGGVVTSFDDDDRYWLCANGHVYVWDYQLSTYTEPSWFYFTAIPAVSFFQDEAHGRYHLDGAGRVTRFRRIFSDYGAAINKVYSFPIQHFGTYDRLKDVKSILVAVRSDTDTEITIRYDTDYETRYDLTDIRAYTWRLSPRNLTHRFLGTDRYAFTVRRKPGCRHVQHFGMTFSNNTVGCDLAVVSAQIFYNYQGEER